MPRKTKAAPPAAAPTPTSPRRCTDDKDALSSCMTELQARRRLSARASTLRASRPDLAEFIDSAEYHGNTDATWVAEAAVELIEAVRRDAIARLYEHLVGLGVGELASALDVKSPDPVLDAIARDEAAGGGCDATWRSLQRLYGQVPSVVEDILDAADEHITDHTDPNEAIEELAENEGKPHVFILIGDLINESWALDQRASFDAFVSRLNPQARAELADAIIRA